MNSFLFLAILVVGIALLAVPIIIVVLFLLRQRKNPPSHRDDGADGQ